VRTRRLSVVLRWVAAVTCMLALATLAAAGPAAQGGPVLTLAPANEPGARLVVSVRVVDRKGEPVAGARLHVYQTDSTGHYTHGEHVMDEPHARLSGWVTTDTAGRFELRTIRPGGYPKPIRLGDRVRRIPAHIHMDWEASGPADRHWQAVFADDSLLTDPYWRDWVKKLGQPVLQAKREGGTWRASLTLVLQ
jgi:protocatechuate 3,4-dioxygenase beta subunit